MTTTNNSNSQSDTIILRMQLYLNNSGHRWVNVDDKGNRDRLTVRFPETCKTKRLAVKYWEAIGNFAVPYVRVSGKAMQLRQSMKCEGQWTVNNAVNREGQE